MSMMMAGLVFARSSNDFPRARQPDRLEHYELQQQAALLLVLRNGPHFQDARDHRSGGSLEGRECVFVLVRVFTVGEIVRPVEVALIAETCGGGLPSSAVHTRHDV